MTQPTPIVITHIIAICVCVLLLLLLLAFSQIILRRCATPSRPLAPLGGSQGGTTCPTLLV